MHVRRATEDDIDFLSTLSREVQRLHAEALPHLFKQPTPEAFAAPFFRQQLADPNAFILIATRDDERCGFLRGVIVHDPETQIRHAWSRLHCKYIAVSPGRQGTGCGHALIGAVVQFAKARGIRTITGDVWSFNTRMRAFLARERHIPYCENQMLDVDTYEAACDE